jgi:hypothetical protein
MSSCDTRFPFIWAGRHWFPWTTRFTCACFSPPSYPYFFLSSGTHLSPLLHRRNSAACFPALFFYNGRRDHWNCAVAIATRAGAIYRASPRTTDVPVKSRTQLYGCVERACWLWFFKSRTFVAVTRNYLYFLVFTISFYGNVSVKRTAIAKHTLKTLFLNFIRFVVKDCYCDTKESSNNYV